MRTWVTDEPLARLANVVSEYGIRLISAAVGLILLGVMIIPSPYGQAFVVSAVTLLTLTALTQLLVVLRKARSQMTYKEVVAVTSQDPLPCFVTSCDGQLIYKNPAAVSRFTDSDRSTLAGLMGDFFANPVAVLRSLEERAQLSGNSQENMHRARGHIRLSVQSLDEAGFLWRFDEMNSPCLNTKSDHGLAFVEANAAGRIVALNQSAQDLLGPNVSHIDRVFNTKPLQNDHIYDVAGVKGVAQCRVSIISTDDGHQLIYLIPANEPKASTQEDDLEDLPVGLLQLRFDGTIVNANRLARELVSPQNTDVIGVCLTEQLEGLGRPIRDWLDDAANGRGLGRPEILRVCAPDVESYLQVTLSRVQTGGEVRLMAVISDATKLKTLEAQFVQSQKMQAIGQLAGGVAHDFNNLLTAISGHCDLMMLRHDKGDPDYADLVQIHQNANRAASLVGQLLAFSRKQTLDPQVIDVRDTLADLTHLLNRLVGEKVALTLHHEPGLPSIRADRRQLEQVFMNLVVNARDAMPEGGEIRVETKEKVFTDEFRRDRAKLPAGRYVVVKVEDHGSGIPEDKVSKIFEPFFTTKKTGEGTGLGLSTAYGIVKQSGGFIFVDSALGVGTVFTLYFPVYEQNSQAKNVITDNQEKLLWAANTLSEAQEETHAVAAGQTSAPVALRSFPEGVKFEGVAPIDPPSKPQTMSVGHSAHDKEQPDLGIWKSEFVAQERAAPCDSDACEKEVEASCEAPSKEKEKPSSDSVILLVEDEAPVRAFASRALRMRGYTVIEAENAEEALATLEDKSLKIDVFVTDVIMPGMDGPTWVRKALEVRPDTKVVFVSGYAEDSFGDEKARIPNSVFLPKPFSLGELTATVQDQVH